MASSRTAFGLIVVYGISVVLSAAFSLTNPEWSTVVPLLGLETRYHFLLVVYVIPLVVGIVVTYLALRGVTPLYLRLRTAMAEGDSRIVYAPPTSDPNDSDVYLRRSLLVAFLVLGILSIIIHYVDPHLFMTDADYEMFVRDVGDPRYAPPVSITLAGLLIPLAVAVWSIVWILQDCNLYEEQRVGTGVVAGATYEPLWLRPAKFLQGYSGISSLLFVISIAALFIATGESLMSAVFTILIPIFAVVQCIPVYLFYTRIDRGFLLQRAERLSS